MKNILAGKITIKPLPNILFYLLEAVKMHFTNSISSWVPFYFDT